MMAKRRLIKNKRTQRQREILAVALSVVVTLIFASFVVVIMDLNFGKKHNEIPVAVHGQLHVQGQHIVDEHGQTFQLRGVSTHGINLRSDYHEYINPASLKYMRDEWGVNVVRVARYTPNNDAEWIKNVDWDKIVKEKIQYAIDAGMYVIIDWHVLKPGDPNIHKNDAIKFFTDIASQYKDYPNVIYEICNEPNSKEDVNYDVSWDNHVKPYAEQVITAIPKIDKQAIIAVGSSTWSQDLDKVAANPLTCDDNLVYTLHFYAASHKKLRTKLQTAIDDGLPVLISECGMCSANGDGEINYSEATKWIDLLNKNKIGYVVWQLSNKDEGSSLIKHSCEKMTDWSYQELSAHGQWLVDTLKQY